MVIIMKKTLALILVFMLSLCPLYVLSSSASDNFVIEDGVLLSYTGEDSVVTIPEDVYYIADKAFRNNTSVSKINLHSGVNIIGNEAFYGCTSLSAVTNTDGVSSVGAYAFLDTPFLLNSKEDIVCINNVVISAKGIGKLKLSDNIISVAPYAFSGNSSVTSFTGGKNLAEIGEGAFYGCTNLSSVNVGEKLSYVGPLAFHGTKFQEDSSEDFVTLGDGILVKYNGSDSEVIVPDDIRQIVGGAFYGNSNIESLAFGENLTYIGMRAFVNCSSLKNVSLPESLLVLEKEAFAKCSSLINIVVPSSVKLMGEGVFYRCTSLDFAKINADVDLPASTFESCSALRAVAFSHNPAYLGDSSFKNCSSLENLALPDSVEFIGENTFSGAENVTVSCNEGSYAYGFLLDKGVDVLQCGDSNADGKVNIRDATYIQKYVANIVTLTSLEKLRAETNFDGKINIRDATFIQKHLAGLA